MCEMRRSSRLACRVHGQMHNIRYCVHLACPRMSMWLPSVHLTCNNVSHYLPMVLITLNVQLCYYQGRLCICNFASCCLFAGWVPPSLSSLSPAAASHAPAVAAAAAVQPVNVQPPEATSNSPAALLHESGDSQALVGLQSYASDSEGNSSNSGESASSAKNKTLGPFF